jgi:transcriptional regulator with XRE-family HTH domain
MTARKEQIRELLMGARARIDPHDVGLRRAGRSRIPGLRREEVAVLADVSVKWYTWLEQGRDLNFSEDVVARVSTALKLSPRERRYLSALIQRRGVAAPPREPKVSEALWRSVQFVPVPSLVMTRRWDILAWNPLITKVYRDYAAVPCAERNLLRIVLTDRKYQKDRVAYEQIARKMLREFRVDFAQFADPTFEDLVAELKVTAPDFERLWKIVEIRDEELGIGVVQHSEFGELRFDRVSYVPESDNFLRVLIFTPRDARTAAVIASLSSQRPEQIPPAGVIVGSDEDANVLRHTSRHDEVVEPFADGFRTGVNGSNGTAHARS